MRIQILQGCFLKLRLTDSSKLNKENLTLKKESILQKLITRYIYQQSHNYRTISLSKIINLYVGIYTDCL